MQGRNESDDEFLRRLGLGLSAAVSTPPVPQLSRPAAFEPMQPRGDGTFDFAGSAVLDISEIFSSRGNSSSAAALFSFLRIRTHVHTHVHTHVSISFLFSS